MRHSGAAHSRLTVCADELQGVRGQQLELLGSGTMSGTGRNAMTADGLDHGNGVLFRGGGASATSGTTVYRRSISVLRGRWSTTVQDIRDGTSKTILAGESVPQWCGWSMWMWFDGSTATCGIPMNYFKWTSPPTDPLANANTSSGWQYCYGFMSRHTAGCNFASCDGGVHFMSDQIDLNVYHALATINASESSVPSNSNPGTTVSVEFP